MCEKSLMDLFGPNATEEGKEIVARSAKQSMDDMADVINKSKKREKSLRDFFGDNLSPESLLELHKIGDGVAMYLGYYANFTPTPENPHPMSIDEYYSLDRTLLGK